jgi:acyl-ACP thioesterase
LSALEFIDLPARGRRFTARRRVRLADTTASGRLRLDAVARYLQDVANDDVDDAGVRGAWVLRRVALRVQHLPRFGDDLDVVTFCSGTGSRWAERRTTLAVRGASAIESVAIWVCVDEAGRPAPLGASFFDRYGEAAGGRTVSSRLHLSPPPDGAATRPWPLRATDFDVLGHVNNAVYWEAVEDELAQRAPGRRIAAAELEHRVAVEPGEGLELASLCNPDRLPVWLTCDGSVRTAACITLG